MAKKDSEYHHTSITLPQEVRDYIEKYKTVRIHIPNAPKISDIIKNAIQEHKNKYGEVVEKMYKEHIKAQERMKALSSQFQEPTTAEPPPQPTKEPAPPT